MSIEPEPTQPAPEPRPDDRQPDPPVETDPPVAEPEPEPGAETPPPPDATMGTVVSVEPGTWYEVTSVCSTTDMGNGEPCRNLNISTTEPEVYSNAGSIRMVCGRCGRNRPITAFSKLDPQPEMS